MSEGGGSSRELNFGRTVQMGVNIGNRYKEAVGRKEGLAGLSIHSIGGGGR